ncbi:MAG: SsrA-binding protein, partial [Planctomycetes bacterium]|nr:SsrA-binding protein [Planctomycetota bacterium]
LYKYASSQINYDPKRPRKLLLKKKEIVRLVTKKQEAGLTLIPVKIYTKNSFVKLELALAKGKKQFDKRETIKKRETERKLQSVLKRKHL